MKEREDRYNGSRFVHSNISTLVKTCISGRK